FLLIPPPPRPPLFPYTTLFRSRPLRALAPRRHLGSTAGARADQVGCGGPNGLGGEPGQHRGTRPPACRWGAAAAQTGGPQKGIRDRKSTRLNSSHDQISYAVFC